MIPQSEPSSPRCPRAFTLLVLIIAAAAIALANLSAELESEGLLLHVWQHGSVERPYGWPLQWYWRRYDGNFHQVPLGTYYDRPFADCWQHRWAPWHPRWPVSQFSVLRLIANLAIWLAILAGAALACRWLLRRYRPRLLWRPRLTTLLLLAFITLLALLSNLSCDAIKPRSIGTRQVSYGWPLIWFRYFDLPNMVSLIREWDYSTAALAGNVATWLAMLAAATLAWESFLRRRQPQLRWSLRTMLVAVALAAAACAWFIAARNRADEQEMLIAWADETSVERWGPQWLDVVGADRLRQRIVGVQIQYFHDKQDNEQNFKQLAKLPRLRFLDVYPDTKYWPHDFTPVMASALGDMRQLRMLNFKCQGYDRENSQAAARACLKAISKLADLERLSVALWADNSNDLETLAGLKHLQSLRLEIVPFVDRGDESREDLRRKHPLHLLERLPPFPRLERLDVHDSEIGDEDLDRLTAMPRLKSLNLSWTWITDAGLAQLASLDRLEELAIDEDMATATGFESLAAIKSLKAVHLAPSDYEYADHSASIALDDGNELPVLPGELARLRRILQALRQSHPGIVIDTQYHEFERRNAMECAGSPDHDFDTYVRRVLNER